MTIYTLFINGKQKDYTDKKRAYAVARHIYTLEEVLANK